MCFTKFVTRYLILIEYSTRKEKLKIMRENTCVKDMNEIESWCTWLRKKKAIVHKEQRAEIYQ